MEQSASQPLTRELAHDVAMRLGAKAVLIGDVAPLGSGYVLTARLVGVADSVTLLAERETATDAAGLISRGRGAVTTGTGAHRGVAADGARGAPAGGGQHQLAWPPCAPTPRARGS